MRIGHGYDVHKLVEGRDLSLGGVKIPFEKGVLGHSDADVLLHAVSDSLWAQRPWGTSASSFPIPILPTKGRILWNFCELWEKKWQKPVIGWEISM